MFRYETGAAPRGRRPRLNSALWLAVVLSLLLVRSLVPVAQAEDISANDVCWLNPAPGADGCPQTYAPPDLLGPDAYAAMTPDQRGAMHRLEEQAVNSVLQLHGLPDSDRTAVRTWGRSEAEARLFELVVTAITASPDTRTPDQQQAVDWMASLVHALTEQEARRSGAEYAKWAGLDLHKYWQLVTNGASESVLAAFLSTPASPYDNPDPSQATGGFCKYQPPDPDADYDASNVQSCYTACTDEYLCTPPPPTFDQFVTWGRDAVVDETLTGDEQSTAETRIAASAVSIMAAAATVGGSPILLKALDQLVWKVVYTTSLETMQVLEAATKAISVSSAVLRVVGSVSLVTELVTNFVTAVLESIRIADTTELPIFLATRVVKAREPTDAEVPGAMLDTDGGDATLMSLFAHATLPLARTDVPCDNDDPAIIDVCLNQPRPRPASPTDPHFVVSDADGGHPSVSPGLTLEGSDDVPARTVRLSGHWFVVQPQDAPSTTAEQNLALAYTDWEGQIQVVTLVDDPDQGLLFAGYVASSDTTLDLDTCEADGTCWSGDTIRYQAADGSLRQARIEAYAAPTGTPTYSPAQPVETKTVTFDANGFAPSYAVGPIRYAWQFQKAGCGLPCTTVTSSGTNLTSQPSYLPPVSGATASISWATSGTYSVRLTATDSEGRVASTTFGVQVEGVPSQVALDQADPPSPAGTPTTLEGEIWHAGRLDNLDVTVVWGDGTRDRSAYGPNVITLLGSPVHLANETTTLVALSATHTYTAPGIFHGSVIVTNIAGQTARATFTRTVH